MTNNCSTIIATITSLVATAAANTTTTIFHFCVTGQVFWIYCQSGFVPKVNIEY